MLFICSYQVICFCESSLLFVSSWGWWGFVTTVMVTPVTTSLNKGALSQPIHISDLWSDPVSSSCAITSCECCGAVIAPCNLSSIVWLCFCLLQLSRKSHKIYCVETWLKFMASSYKLLILSNHCYNLYTSQMMSRDYPCTFIICIIILNYMQHLHELNMGNPLVFIQDSNDYTWGFIPCGLISSWSCMEEDIAFYMDSIVTKCVGHII